MFFFSFYTQRPKLHTRRPKFLEAKNESRQSKNLENVLLKQIDKQEKQPFLLLLYCVI